MRLANTGLVRISAAGGEAEPLTTLEEGETAHRWPHILPGGQSVLFTVVKGQGSENMEIAALTLDTGVRVPLVSGGSNPHYAPTGHLVYGVDGTLRAVRFDPDRLAVMGDPVPVLEGVVTNAFGAAQFSFASDGSLVYLPGGAGGGAERTLTWVDRQGNETPLDLPEARSYQIPRLSPDGTRLAVTVSGDNVDVWVSELATGTLRRLTTDPARDDFPIWTPDGERVVRVGPDRRGRGDRRENGRLSDRGRAAGLSCGGLRLKRVLTDNGKEFKASFVTTCATHQVRHTRTKPRHAWTNGFVERLQGTILHEHWRVEFRRHYFRSARASCALGFSWTLDCERVLAGGVSR